MEFKSFDLIKGKDLKGHLLCKVLPEDMILQGYQYKIGENIDVNPLETEYRGAGLSFRLLEIAINRLGYDTLAIIEVAEDEDVFVDSDTGIFRTHRIVIKQIMSLQEEATWEYLIDNKVDITYCHNYALRWAVSNNNLKLVKYLHKKGADLTDSNNGAIEQAVLRNNLDMVKYLYENGADKVDGELVIYAAKFGYFEILKYLCEKGVDITVRHNTAVIKAAEKGYLDIVKYLHEHGADIAEGKNYSIPIIEASKNGHLQVVKYLHENTKYIACREKEKCLFIAAGRGHLEVVKYLHEMGMDIHAFEDAAVKEAAVSGHLEVVKYLLKNGAVL